MLSDTDYTRQRGLRAMGTWGAATKKAGHHAEMADTLIAATAIVHGLKVATLNRNDFLAIGCEISGVLMSRESEVKSACRGSLLATPNDKGHHCWWPQTADKVSRKALVIHGSLLYFGFMLKKPELQQHELEMVSVESLVPAEHLLRKIERVVDFGFIRDRVKHLYADNNGRPALDPVVLFKLLLLGYLYGVRSERQLMREVEVNVSYRWFLGLKLRDKVPDASTLSQNRRRRFAESTIYQEIFDEIVLLAVHKGLASGSVLYTDSTHLKANANKNKFDLEQVAVKPQAYLAALDAAVTEDRAEHGKKPLKPSEPEPETREIKVSRTDKDSGYMVRDGKPKGFFYLDHRTVDGRHAIITDTHVTPANVHDSVPYLGRLDRQRERFNFNIRAVGVDAGYAAAAITQGLEERNIYGVIGYRTPTHRDGYFYKREYRYDEKLDVYICPNGQLLNYRTTNREGYRQYHSDPDKCRNCPVRQKCTQSSNATKVVTRHVWEASRERIDQNRLNRVGKRIYKRRKETVERSFADAKQLHGHRYARMRGLTRVRQQCLLAASAQNIKKIALMLGQIVPNMTPSTLLNAFAVYRRLLQRNCQRQTVVSGHI